MSILLSPKCQLAEPLWLPGPRYPALPMDHLHLWRVRLEPRSPDHQCPVDRDQAEKLRTALFRNDIIERYAAPPGTLAGPASGLRVAVAQCDDLALVAVSRSIREIGLDTERVRDDIPFDDMATDFLDPACQWDLRITWSRPEKAWKFFQFWTSTEACDQAGSRNTARQCRVRGFMPAAGYVAALAIDGPAAEVLHWEWHGPR